MNTKRNALGRSITAHLCDSCKDLRPPPVDAGNDARSYRVALPQALSNADGPSGCQFLKILLEESKLSENENRCNSDVNLEISIKNRANLSNCQYSIFFGLVAETSQVYKEVLNGVNRSAVTGLKGEYRGGIICQVVTFPDDPNAKIISGRVIEPDVFGPYNTSLIKTWFATCVESHKSCKQAASIPKRLLYVGNHSDDKVELRDCDEFPPPASTKYIALSYMWGGDQPLKTRKDNYQAMKRGFQVEKLPLTLRDAVKACRTIGVQWLWIDALCIIQDDDTDKLQEITKMGDIYSHAALTIVAATAPNTQVGFLDSTFGEASMPFQHFNYPSSDGQIGEIYLIRLRADPDHAFPSEKRAWTMQERLLSPRLLFFSNGRIDWICKMCHVYAGASSSPSVSSISDHLTEQTDAASEWATGGGEKAIAHWFHLCSDYTRRQLTDASDRLPALSALAKEFCRIHPELGDYLAGLWSYSLPHQLLWSPTKPRWTSFEMTRAPSWSWAALEEEIYLPSRARPPLKDALEVLEYSVTYLEGSDKFGALSGGFLRVNGRLEEAVWDISEQTILATGLSAVGNPRAPADKHDYLPGGPRSGQKIPVWCLEVEDASDMRKFLGFFTGLLVMPHRVEPDTFQRVGMYCLALARDFRLNEEQTKASRSNVSWFQDVQPRVITLV